MSKDAESIQIGTCPICQYVLAREGDFVTCPNGDYKAEFTKWDEVWNAFDAKVKERYRELREKIKKAKEDKKALEAELFILGAMSEDSEKLIKDLVTLTIR